MYEEERFKALTDELYDTFIKKNSDYGNSFSETIEEFGYIPAVARMNDKLKRAKNIVKGQRMRVDESLRDSLMDLANYAILTVMEIDKESEGDD